MRSFRDGFGRQALLNRGPERPIPRSFRDGFGRPVMASANRIQSIPWTFLFWADRITGNNGDPVETWEDIKGGYDCASVGGEDPVLTKNIASLNGHSAVTFDGNSALQNELFSAEQPITIIGVWNVTLDGESSELIDGGIDADHRGSFYWRNDTPDRYRLTSDSLNQLDYNRALPSSYVIVMVDLNGASSAIYEGDPTTPLATGNAGSADMQGITIGCVWDLTSYYALTGNIALVGGVVGGLDAAGKARAYQILCNYYGIS